VPGERLHLHQELEGIDAMHLACPDHSKQTFRETFTCV